MTKLLWMITLGTGMLYLVSEPSNRLSNVFGLAGPALLVDSVANQADDTIPKTIIGRWTEKERAREIEIVRNQAGYVLLCEKQFRRLHYQEGMVIGEACPHRFYEIFQKGHRSNKLCEVKILLLDPKTLVIDGVGKFISLAPK